MSARTSAERPPIHPERLRTTQGGFAYVPNRFLHGGFFAVLTDQERSLYLFLVIAGDRRGISFYSQERICSVMATTLHDYLSARNRLIEADLIAFDGSQFQVLSLPKAPVAPSPRPLENRADFEERDPATIRQFLERELGAKR